MARTSRQLKLLDLISKMEIKTQEALADALREEGYNVTQATISRDIKELGLVKVMTENSGYKYAQPQPQEQKNSAKLLNLFREAVITIDYSENLIIIKTLSGSANAAAALVDKMNIEEIIGCVAGDDTILIVIKNKHSVYDIVDKLKLLME